MSERAHGKRRSMWPIFVGSWMIVLVAGISPRGGTVEVWTDDTFADFIAGTLGAAGANLYVSATGWVQPIHRWDLDEDGHLDLLFNQTHDAALRLPATVYAGGRGGLTPNVARHLPTDGGRFALVGDVNGDGFTDALLVNGNNGTHEQTGALLYWGEQRGLHPAHRTRVLPNRMITAAALGRLFPHLRGRLSGAFALGPDGRLAVIRMFSRHPELVMTSLTGVTSVAIGNGAVYIVREGRPYRLRLAEDGQIRELLPLPGRDVERLWLAHMDENESLDLLYRRKGRPLQWLKDGDPTGSPRDLEIAWGARAESPRDLPVMAPSAIAVADFDRDGRPDLAAAVADEVLVFPSIASGRRSPMRWPAPWATAIAVGDWNADGWTDLAVAIGRDRDQYETASLIYWGSREGFSSRRMTPVASAGARDIASGEFTGDGIEDLLIVNGIRGRVRGDIPSLLYWGAGRRGFRPERVLTLPTVGAYESSAADLNDDGYVDLIIACAYEDDAEGDRGAMIFWGTPAGPDIARPTYLPTRGTISSSIADLNRDGRLDLIFSEFRDGTLKIIWGSPFGYERAPVTTLASPSHRDPRFHLVADLNADGWLDIFVPDIRQRTSLLYWGGAGGFNPNRMTLIPGFGTTTAEAADLNADGWLDLILCSFWDPDTRNYHVPSLILWGGPKGFDASRRSELETWGCHDVAVADLNRDGALDLVFSNYHAGHTRSMESFIYWGGPGGYRNDRRMGLPNDSAAGIQIGDFNEDGWPDIAFSNHIRQGDHRTRSRIYWGSARGFDRRRVSVLPTLGPHQMMTTDMGNLYDRRLVEVFASRIVRVDPSLVLQSLMWKAECPPTTALRFQIRAGATPEALREAAWWGPGGPKTFFTESPARLDDLPLSGPYFQYRVWFELSPTGRGPRLDRVELTFVKRSFSSTGGRSRDGACRTSAGFRDEDERAAEAGRGDQPVASTGLGTSVRRRG